MSSNEDVFSLQAHPCDRFIQNFYSKFAQIVVQSRVSFPKEAKEAKQNTWFNYCIHDVEILKDQIRNWKSDLYVPLNIEILLDTSQLSSDKALLLGNEDHSLQGRPEYIVLEQWRVQLEKS
eukprot:Sdes_comp10795_c0_seq1m2459